MLISASHDLVDYDLGHLPGVSSIVFFVPAPGIDTRNFGDPFLGQDLVRVAVPGSQCPALRII